MFLNTSEGCFYYQNLYEFKIRGAYDLTLLIEKINSMSEQTALTGKILTANQAAEFMGISLSYLYKLTHNRTISFFKPNGKMVYFSEGDLIQYLTSNRVITQKEIDQQATDYIVSGKAPQRGKGESV